MDSSIAVTAMITHRVRPGREAGYEKWLKGIAAVARNFAGYLGAHILRLELSVSTSSKAIQAGDPGMVRIGGLSLVVGP